MNNMKLAVRRVLSKYATFSGRAPRAEFWWWMLACFLILSIAGLIDGLLFPSTTGPDGFVFYAFQPFSTILSLAFFLPNLAVGVRRLHDIGRRGWWMLLFLVPLIGFLVLLYFYVQPSQPEDNAYGAPNPLV